MVELPTLVHTLDFLQASSTQTQCKICSRYYNVFKSRNFSETFTVNERVCKSV